MLTKVKIAPFERWCPRAKQYVQHHLDAGREVPDFGSVVMVGIETNSMRIIDGERAWLVVQIPDSIEFVDGRFACEHMIELD